MRFLDTSRVRVRLDQRIAARDGTELSIDLYLPPQRGRYPVVLYRTATDNNRSPRASGSRQAEVCAADRWKGYAAQGFIVATADVRGRGDSGGAFIPFVHEGADGAATVDWLREQPECNGRVGTFGTGYAAFCAWAAIAAGAPIDAIVSISPFGDVGKGFLHRSGSVRLDWLFWMHLTGGRTLQPAALPPWPEIHRYLPLKLMDLALGRSDIPWQTWLDHLDPKDPFWDPLQLAESLAMRPIPGLHITGWWDSQFSGARYYYEAARRSGGQQSIIIGPWDSSAIRRPVAAVGGFNFGLRSMIDVDDVIGQFFAARLRDEKNEWSNRSVRCFVTGRNEWIDGRDWPESGNELRQFNLASGGCANTRSGDGALVEAAVASNSLDEITHNPGVPVQFQPNFRSFASNDWSLTLDQGHITARDEALVYTSDPLGKPVTVWGRPSVTVSLQCSTPDADIYLLLSDVFPTGSSDLHLSHAAVRLATVRDFTPTKPLSLTLELDEIAHDFLPGHSVRLTVVPSLFPMYARNLHRSDYLSATDAALSVISLRHGGIDHSCLRLPVMRPMLEDS